MEPIIKWYEDSRSTTYTIELCDEQFTGKSFCHPDDDDMASRRTGEHIAEARAIMQAIKFYRKHYLRPQLDALRQARYSMEQAGVTEGVEVLDKQINKLERILRATKKELVQTKRDLTKYIQDKDIFYNRIRAIRSSGQDDLINE